VKALILTLYALAMLCEVSVLTPGLLALVDDMQGRQAVIAQVFAEWGR